MNHPANAVVAATLLALATTASAWRGWIDGVFEPGSQGAAVAEPPPPVREADRPPPAGQGYADARAAGSAYYGWRYPFALPFPSALAAAYPPDRTAPR